MSQDKTVSVKQMIRKATSKIGAVAFLQSYQDHIRATVPESASILDSLERGELLPTPAVQAIKQVLELHQAEMLRQQNEARIARFESKQNQPNQPVKSKRSGVSGSGRYSCQLFVKSASERSDSTQTVLYVDPDGNSTFCAALYHEAQNLVDRKQNDNGMAVYATITSLENGSEMMTVIPVADSVARANKKGAGPAVRNSGTGMSKSMKSYARARNDTCSFSRG